MLRLEDNPPCIFPSVENVCDLRGQWWVAHTRPRAEKALARALVAHHIQYFLPLIERVRFSGGRKRRVLLPLFPSYLFFCGQEDDRYRVLRTNKVAKTIAVFEQTVLLRELASIHRALSSKIGLACYVGPAVGEWCRVVGGPFAGVEGIVVRRNRLARLVLQVTAIGKGAALEIDGDLLEKVTPHLESVS